MRVLVAGAGYVGSELARRLAEAGHDVLALRRGPPPAEPRHASVRWLACDLRDPRSLAALPAEGVEALAYLVAPDTRDDAAYRATYVDALRGLLARLRMGSSLRRVLFASSTSVYAQDDASWVDEDSPAQPEHFTGRRVLEGEDALRRGAGEAIALRLGGIYGPGRESLIARVRSGAAQLPGSPRYTNRIHRDDAARACAHLLVLRAPASCYLGVDREPADQRDVLRWLAARTGAPTPRGPGPDAAGAAPRGKRCRSDRLVASGYSFAFPTYREGYAALIGG